MRSIIKFPPYCVTSYLFVVDEDEDDDEDDGEDEEKDDGEGRNVDEVSEEEQDLRDDEDGETILMIDECVTQVCGGIKTGGIMGGAALRR